MATTVALGLCIVTGKDNGENIMKSITEGPFQMGTIRDTLTEGGEGALHLGPVRARVFADLSAEQKDRYKADIRATNIILQGIPKDIYSLINHYTDAKDIWDNVKMILEGSELTKDDRESQLYDEFEHFCQIKGETIHVYYVRFTKLINDMRNIKMTMPRMQLNSKFVNNMLPEWSRFITEVKLNRVSNASNQKYPTQSSDSPQSSNQPSLLDNFPMDTGSTSKELTLIEHCYSSRRQLFIRDVRGRYNANNQGRPFQRNNARGDVRTGNVGGQNRVGNMNPGQAKPIMCYNYKGIGPIARECTQPKRPLDSDYFKDKMLLMNAHENGVVLDEEQLLFLQEKEHYVEDNEEHVVQSNVSSVRNDALMSIIDDMHEQGVQSMSANKQVKVVNDTLTSDLAEI
ncbi:hypothetical protein Tco_1508441 [Tanacetum coccineum]